MSKKLFKKINSLILAIIMLMGLSFNSFAAVVAPVEITETQSVTIHKILQSKEDMEKTGKDGKKVFPGTKGLDGTEYIGEEIDDIYSFFTTLPEDDDTIIDIGNVYFAMKYKDGSNKGKYVTYDTSNKEFGATDNLEDPNILGGLTEDDIGLTLQTDKLSGNFEIVEIPEKSTYVGLNGETLTGGKAVPVEITLPLVNENGIVQYAHVYPKNTQDKPKIDKDFGKGTGNSTGANLETPRDEKDKLISSEIGKEIPYEIKTEIPKDAKYKTIVWQDTMTKGLDYILNSMAISTTPDISLVKTTDYSLTETTKGFELSLTDNGLKKVEEKAKTSAVTFLLKYKGKITKDAIVDIPEKNDVKLIYSNQKKENITPKDVKPSNKQIKVTKTWDKEPVPEGVEVTYTLYEVAQNGELIFVDKVDLKGPTYDHTFSNLDDAKTYRVIESVKGYVPEYTSSGNGNLEIKNTNTPNITPNPPKVVTYGKKFVKTNDANKDTAERLAGAEFAVKKDGKYLAKKDDAQKAGDLNSYNSAEKAYQDALKKLSTLISKSELTDEEQREKATLEGQEEGSISKLKEARDTAYKTAYFDYEWVNSVKESNVIKLVSDSEGRFEITGLEEGSYELEEITPPAGYAKLSGAQPFKVGAESYKGTETEVQYNKDNIDAGYGQQIKNKKVSIPQTGGMGTILFTVIGLAIMAFALISLRRKKNEA